MRKYFLKYNEFLNESFSSAKAKFLNTHKISDDDFYELVEIDTTPTKKYLEKMCDWYTKGIAISQIKSSFAHYDNLLLRRVKDEEGKHIPKDINIFKTFDDFKTLLSKFREAIPKSRIKKMATTSIEYLMDTDRVQIVVPKTREQSEVFGKGTQWCISSNQPEYEKKWKEYYWDSQATFYFVWFKDKPLTDPLYKVALFIYEQTGYIETRNALDIKISDEDAKELFDEYGLDKEEIAKGRFSTMNPDELIKTYTAEPQLESDGKPLGRILIEYPHLRSKETYSLYKSLIDKETNLNSYIHYLTFFIGSIEECQTEEWFDYYLSKNPDVEDLEELLERVPKFDTPTNRKLIEIVK